MMKKKNFFAKKFSAKYPLGYVVSRIDKASDCFSTKKTVISLFNFHKTLKKHTKTLSKQIYVLKLIMWSGTMQFCQLDRKSFEKRTSFCWMSENDERKTFLTEKSFTTNCCNAQTDSSFDDTAEKFLSESQEEIRSSFNDEQKKNLFEKKISSTDLLDKWLSVLTKLLFVFRQKKPFIFRSMFQKDEKTYKKFSKQMLVFKVILRTLRKQCRHLAEKKIDQRLINLRSMSKNNGEKYLRKIFSPQTDLIDKQKAVLTSGLTKFRRNDIQKLLNAQWWKKKKFFKKNFFKKSSWIRGKQMWQICRLFFWQKKPLFLRSISEEHEKKQTTYLSKQCFVLKFFLWTRGKQFC